MTRTCVTGTEGFLAPHVVSILESLGQSVLRLDRRSGHDIEHVEPRWLEGVTHVVHCAAHADISRNWDGGNPELLYRDNIEATWALLRACADVPTIKSFVFCSTAAVYGDCPPGIQRTEQDHPSVLSPYAASKLAGENFVQAYAHKYGWRWHVARLVSCIGAGYYHGHVADFVAAARKGIVAPLDRGIAKSFVHVEDAAEALVCMAHGGSGGPPDGIYNVTSSQRWSWRDTVRLMGIMVEPATADRGWVGDPMGLTVSGARLSPWWRARRDITIGCHDALHSLGWPSAKERQCA
jgi:nucleoside-diphosphate-sugar epimerase